LGHTYGLWSQFPLDLEELLRNSVQRFIPTDPLPSVLTPCPDPLQRKLKPVRMVKELYGCFTLRANISV
jgi:hypothetical protein